MKTRMQPIGNVWNKFPRIVRDLSSRTGKSVRLEMEGKQTELDKTIIEAIKDPLTHVVRNSLDHGIETPAEREAAGKPCRGLLTSASLSRRRAGQHRDFRRRRRTRSGCDSRPRRSSAGLSPRSTPPQCPTARSGNLIFLPGFSTAKKVTNISGRGVGMDVVKTNIEKIGGTVDLAERSRAWHHAEDQDSAHAGDHSRADCDHRRRAFRHSASEPAGAGPAGRQSRPETGIEMIQGAPVYRLRGNLCRSSISTTN